MGLWCPQENTRGPCSAGKSWGQKPAFLLWNLEGLVILSPHLTVRVIVKICLSRQEDRILFKEFISII